MTRSSNNNDRSKSSPKQKSMPRRQECNTNEEDEPCLSCVNCRNQTDCGTCPNCCRKVKLGGSGRNHQRCVERICLQLYPTATPYDRSIQSVSTKTNVATARKLQGKQTKKSSSATLVTSTTKTKTSLPTKASPSKSISTSPKEPKRRRSTASSSSVLEQQPSPSKKKRRTTTATATVSTDAQPVALSPIKRTTAAAAAVYNAVSKRNRCMTCPGCTIKDCGTCIHCQGKRKFGGDGKCHMPCVQRYCHVLYPLVTTNGHRGRDRSSRYDNNTSSTYSKSDNTNTTTTATTNQKKVTTRTTTHHITSTTNTSASTKPPKNSKTIQSPPPPPPQPQPCNECIGCRQTQDCNECLPCLHQNMRQKEKKSRSKKKASSTKDTGSNENQICYHRRCYRLLAIESVLQEQQRPQPQPLSFTGTQMQTTSTATTQKNSLRVMTEESKVSGAQRRIVTWADESTKHMDNGTDHPPTNTCFSLTEYLSQDYDTQRFDDIIIDDDDDDDDDDDNEDPDQSTCQTKIYGLARPPAPIMNVCSGCSGARDDELNAEEDHPVLLCDGVQCGREYHMACCIPPLVSLPDDNGEDEPWYCYDCCPDGTTALLQQYLNNNDKDMMDYYDNTIPGRDDIEFVNYRIKQELKAKTNAHAKRKVVYQCPESELVIGAMIHSLALCDGTKLARTRGSHERRESLAPEEYVGKPIRLYDNNHDMYHTGRIVAYRNADSVPSWGDYQSSPSKANASPNESLSGCANMEYLIRFPAGKDHRKSTYHHWIRLEEHSLSVGTTLVWARITSSQWKPSILWLRTSLALIPTLEPIERSKIESSIDISKTKHKVCALVRTFGDEIYSVINVRDQCVDLSDVDATEVHLHSHPDNILLFSIARTEQAEQSRVHDWFKLKQMDPIGPAVLSSRDYWTLNELYPNQDNNTGALDTALLLPNIRRGLDRPKMVRMLYRQGYSVSKDGAASFSCSNIPFDHRTIADMCLNTVPVHDEYSL